MRACTGTAPASWASCANLTTVNVANNTLTGYLPPQWAGLHQLQSLNLSANLFQGPLPGEWRGSSSGNGTVDQGMVSLNNMCAARLHFLAPCVPHPHFYGIHYSIYYNRTRYNIYYGS